MHLLNEPNRDESEPSKIASRKSRQGPLLGEPKKGEGEQFHRVLYRKAKARLSGEQHIG